MKDKKYVLLVTPKGFTRINEKIKSKFNNPEIIVCNEIYMNCFDPAWDTERCDSVCYVYEKKYLESITQKPKFEMSYHEKQK